MGLEKPLELEQGWKELKTPELIKWDNPGNTIAGILRNVELITVDGKRVPQYLVVLGERQFKFLGTYDICQKLTRAHLGATIRIKYLGEDENIRGGPNNKPMKVFSIIWKASEQTTKWENGGPITDEDIPF